VRAAYELKAQRIDAIDVAIAIARYAAARNESVRSEEEKKKKSLGVI
jgi:hypothetical protein